MKTLDQWLESSSSSLSSNDGKKPAKSDANQAAGAAPPGPLLTAHTPTLLHPAVHRPEVAGTEQDEMRVKMRRLLGDEVVLKATTPTSSAELPLTSPTAGHSDTGNFPLSATPAPTAMVPATRPSTGPPPEVEATMRGFDDGPALRPVEAMVVDRGTQTLSTASTQTDPQLDMFPGAMSGGMLYRPPIFGAPPPGGYGGGQPTYQTAAPYFTPVGVDGRPYRQYLHEYEKTEEEEAGKLRAELDSIQNSIDMLIARYRLPPPPK